MFKFASNVVNIEIEEKLYSVTADKALKDKLDTCMKKSDQLQSDVNVTEEKAIELYKNCIDIILGEDAFKHIFEGREINLFDCMDVFMYISDEIENFSKAKKEKYSAYVKDNK